MQLSIDSCQLTIDNTLLPLQSTHSAWDINKAAPDLELLLVEWLNAIVYQTAVGQRLFSRFEVEIHDGRLSARIWGEAIQRERHRPAVEVKGATLTALKVTDRDGEWTAQCVVDV